MAGGDGTRRRRQQQPEGGVMAPINVDFTGVDPVAEPGSGPIPDGEYLVAVDVAQERTSQRGTHGVALQLRIVGGQFDGRLLFDDLWITPAALGYVLHRLRCLGIAVPAGPFILDPERLVSRRARVVVRQEEGADGRVRARVKAWLPAAAGAAPGNADADIPF
jgi:hypothetical protein